MFEPFFLVFSKKYRNIAKNIKLNIWHRISSELSRIKSAKKIAIKISDTGYACFCNLWVFITKKAVKNIKTACKIRSPTGPRYFKNK